MSPTPSQCRAARAILGITQADLARTSGVSLRAITSFEKEESKLNRVNHESIKEYFEREGIIWIAETGVFLNPAQKKPRA
jgi:DNA-binding XRE family transcriptional regulator